MLENITLTHVIGDNLFLLVEFIECLIFSFLGSLLKEIYNTNNIEGYEFEAYKVISSTIVGSLAVVAFKAYFLNDPDWTIMAFLTFTFGLLGFEIFKNLTSFEGIKHLINEISEIIGSVKNLPIGSTSNISGEEVSQDEKKIEALQGFHGKVKGHPPITPKVHIHDASTKDDN